jgi:hypothetical protein
MVLFREWKFLINGVIINVPEAHWNFPDGPGLPVSAIGGGKFIFVHR